MFIYTGNLFVTSAQNTINWFRKNYVYSYSVWCADERLLKVTVTHRGCSVLKNNDSRTVASQRSVKAMCTLVGSIERFVYILRSETSTQENHSSSQCNTSCQMWRGSQLSLEARVLSPSTCVSSTLLLSFTQLIKHCSEFCRL